MAEIDLSDQKVNGPVSTASRRRVLAISVCASLLVHALLVVLFSQIQMTEKVPASAGRGSSYVEFAASAPSPNPRAELKAIGEKRLAKPLNKPPSKSANSNHGAIGDFATGGFRRQTIEKLAARATDIDAESAGMPTSEFSTDPMSRQTEGAHGWSAGVQYGNEMGLAFTLESLSFFQALHARISTTLVYPDDFSRQKITGTVRIEAEVGRDGQLIKFRSSTADERLLQTFCFAMLMQALSRPLQERYWLETERAVVVFEFDFRTKVPFQAPSNVHDSIEKNRLTFHRENEIEPWLNEKVAEIFTHYIPPIIPFPGGFYVDLVLAYKYVNNLIEGAPTESQQRRARIEKLHEQLKTTLRHTTDNGGS